MLLLGQWLKRSSPQYGRSWPSEERRRRQRGVCVSVCVCVCVRVCVCVCVFVLSHLRTTITTLLLIVHYSTGRVIISVLALLMEANKPEIGLPGRPANKAEGTFPGQIKFILSYPKQCCTEFPTFSLVCITSLHHVIRLCLDRKIG